MKISWTSKIVVIILGLLAVFLGQQKFRQLQLQKKIEREKSSLERQLTELQGNNEQLNATLSYLSSKTYKEMIAKEQLGMQKDGEIVYSFSDAPASGSAVLGATTNKPEGNFQKWINYFLNK